MHAFTPPPRPAQAALTSDQQDFNHLTREPRGWPGISAPAGAHVMDGWEKLGPGDTPIKLATLPLPLFANGHGYFVQAAHKRLNVRPFAAHATYSLDNHDGVAKAQRFRENGLWAVDPESYFEGKYLALNASVPPSLQAAIDRYVAKKESPYNIDTHIRSLTGYVAELRDALALAEALGRTLILPRWTCYCDRLWSGSDDIFHFGCMYPGSQDGKFLPFVCPMDHVLSPSAWVDTQYRDAAFLDSPRLPASHRAVIDIKLVERSSLPGLSAAERRSALPLGTSGTEAATLLAPLEQAPVLRLPHARNLLCGLGSADATTAFNRRAERLLRVPAWTAKCFTPCKTQLAKWLSPEYLAGARGESFYLQIKAPVKFRHGECALNIGTE